jgi:hypothetical protein
MRDFFALLDAGILIAWIAWAVSIARSHRRTS